MTAWSKLGNTSWSYDDLKQACLETVQIHPPSPADCQAMGFDSHPDHAAGSGPVQVSAHVEEEHPMTKAYFQTLRDLGYKITTSVFNDHSAIGQGLYFTQDATSLNRSDANTAFWRPLKDRPNVTISLETMVKRIILDGNSPNVTARGVEVLTSNGDIRTFTASQEVILSAGSFGTPKILELSGIGSSALLQKHGTPVVVENAHVGEKLRNHMMAAVHYEMAGEIPPEPGFNVLAFSRSRDADGLVEVLQAYDGKDDTDQAYDEAVKSIFLNQEEGSCGYFMGSFGVPNAWTFGVLSAIPFSQGSTHIQSSDVNDNPTVDLNFFSHPLDIEVVSRHLKTVASFASRPSLKPFFKPDENSLANADLDRVKEYVRQEAMTTHHPVGTASMRPQKDGGVVDEHLKVYGTRNLRVVDASVIPMLAHGNPIATVYGIAMRASSIIKQEVKPGK